MTSKEEGMDHILVNRDRLILNCMSVTYQIDANTKMVTTHHKEPVGWIIIIIIKFSIPKLV
mgnify:FL=1